MTGRSSAATRPTSRGDRIPAVAAEARLTRLLRTTGEPSLDALQARATADPAWFWGAATDDIAIPWTRRPREIADFSGGPAWTRWWSGGSFDWSWAAIEPRAARDPGRDRRDMGGRGRQCRRAHQRRPGDTCPARGRAACAGWGSRPATASGSSCRCCPRPSSRSWRSAASVRSSRRSSRATGAPAIASRLADCDARLLITADGFLRRGSWVDLKSVADAAVASAPSVERVLVVARAGATARGAVDGRPRRPLGRRARRPRTRSRRWPPSATPRRRT